MELKKYSILATAIMLFQRESDAQIIYTDIPDTIMPNNSDLFIDFNNDGTFEIKLTKTFEAFWDSDGPFYSDHFFRYLSATPENYNSVLGTGGIFNDNVAALNLGTPINNNGEWLKEDNFNMASWKKFVFEYGSGGENTTWDSWGSGDWLYNTEDKYLGVRFLEGTDTLYGWIRLYVHDLIETTVKDYAYQKTPGLTLGAGVDFAVNANELQQHDLDIRSLSNKTVEVHLRSPQFIGGKIAIINSLGEIVKTLYLDQPVKTVELHHLPVGIYVVTITKDDKQVSKSFLLH